MENRPDFLVVGADGRTKLAVEVKAKQPASTKWASEFRRNLMAHRLLTSDCYFLLASSDRFYLWSPKENGADSAPDFEVESKQALGPWLERMKTSSAKLSEPALELLIESWLHEVVTTPHEGDVPEWMQDSGLYAAIHGARLRSQSRH